MIRNWQLKLCSLLVAILLALIVNYFFATTEYGTSVVQLIAPVEVQNVPDNKYVIWPETRQVELTVQGSSLFISKVALSSPVVKVAMPDGAVSSFKAKISRDNINLPATVKLLGVKPSELEFGVDNIVEKTLPVVVPQIGKLPAEYKLDKIRVLPAEVTVRGPSQDLKSVSSIETAPINLSALTQSTELEEELRTVWNLLPGAEKRVKVGIDIVDAIGEVTFANVVVNLDVTNEDLKKLNSKVIPKAVTVIAKGPKKALHGIKKDDLIVTAVLDKSEQLKELLELSIAPLDSVELIVTPKKVSIEPTPTATPDIKKGTKKK